MTEVQVVNCTGPTNIVAAFNLVDPTDEIKGQNKGWKELRLRRGEEELGTLHDVRQAYTYLCMLTAGWRKWKKEHLHEWRTGPEYRGGLRMAGT